jgi:integrase
VFAGLLAFVYAGVELAEAEVAVGDEGAQAELAGERRQPPGERQGLMGVTGSLVDPPGREVGGRRAQENVNGTRVRRYKAEWTKNKAEAELAKALLQIEPQKPKRPGLTLAQAADRYLASKARKRTIEADRRQLELLKVEFGAETPLADITASRISDYKAKRLAAVRKIGRGEAAFDRRLTASAVNRPLALLRHLLRLAHEEWGAIDNVPRIRLGKEPQGRLRWLAQEEITRLLEAAAKSRNKELRAAVILALNTGLRLGELIGLTWDRVDLSPGCDPARDDEERPAP